MTGGDVIGVHEERATQQEVELDLIVASEARVRRASPIVLAHEVVDDMLLELALEVHVVMARANCIAHAARVLHILYRAAPLIHRGGGFVLY